MPTRKEQRQAETLKEVPLIGKAPEGAVLSESPDISAPGSEHTFHGVYGEWLGEPDRRYGKLTSSRKIPDHTKLEMLTDPIIGLCQAYIGSTLVRATRVIECIDEGKRLFFEAMFRDWEREFILQASMAIAFGGVGLIKRFAFQTPIPVELNAVPVWDEIATPYICTGFDSVYPVGSSPRFDNKNKHFEGMNTPDGRVDRYFSLWLTIGKAWAFGAYKGWGRLRNVYRDWWMKQFGRDLFLVHLQKNIDRAVMVSYPPGKTGGKSHRDTAIGVGNSVRTGATVAMPSVPYENIDTLTAQNALTTIRKWSLEFLEGSSKVTEFTDIDDHYDQKISVGYLVPPQMYIAVRQSALGGPTTADVLGDLAERMLLINAAEIDRHLNDYVFPAVDHANFPAGSPPVRCRTVGMPADVKEEMMKILEILMGKAEAGTTQFDAVEALRRLELPIKPVVEFDPNDIPEDIDEGTGEEEDDENPFAGPGEAAHFSSVSSPDDPPREVIEAMAGDTLSPVPRGRVGIGDSDVNRAVRKLADIFPEIFGTEEEE